MGQAMPVTFHIDPVRRRIFSTLEGVVTDKDLVQFQQNLLADANFDPSHSHLADCSGITRFDVSSQTVRSLALPTLYAQGARLAIVAKLEIVFGMARMFQMLREGIAEEVRVFRDLDQACQWLDS
jgi:hypothetical protein